MLLLMMHADFENAQYLPEAHFVCRRQQPFDRFIDVCPIGPNLRHIGPREHATLRARMPRASRHVVGIEQIRELWIEDLIARQMRHQQKLFKKPGRVGAMPLGRAGIGHRLNNLVFRIQRRGTTLRLAADRVKGLRPHCPRIVSGRGPGTAHGRNVAPVNLGDTRKCCRRRHASPYAYGFTRRQKATTSAADLHSYYVLDSPRVSQPRGFPPEIIWGRFCVLSTANYLTALAPAIAAILSCWPVPPLAPMAPINLPFTTIGIPPSEAIGRASLGKLMKPVLPAEN